MFAYRLENPKQSHLRFYLQRPTKHFESNHLIKTQRVELREMDPVMFGKGQKERERQKNQTSDDKYQWHRPEARTSQILQRVAEGEGHEVRSHHQNSGEAGVSNDISGSELLAQS
ncbi:hypothetical protein Tco_1513904 [Tanacetum coccineum]